MKKEKELKKNILLANSSPCNEVGDILSKVSDYSDFIKTNKKIEYLNMPVAFDIETTSFYEGNEKRAIMYEFSFSINGYTLIGRTWKEFITIVETISEFYGLTKNRRVIVYVHNLSYEFQFMRKWINWLKVFSLDSRKVCYALSDIGIEFRCSYILSNSSLDNVGKNLVNYKVRKLTGSLDYEKARHSKTPLTNEELQYCINDVLVVCAYIQECIERDGDITKIPLTKTGYVRQYCKKNVIGTGKHKNLRNRELIHNLTLSVDEYKQLKRAFQGGFTHANPIYSRQTLNNVASYDFTSSYPYVMISEKFPMSKSELVNIESKEDFSKNLKLYCCLFDVEIIGLESSTINEAYLSESHCYGLVNPVINNGRIVKADKLYTTLTEQDYIILEAFYTWESIGVANFRRYRKGYLPTEFVTSILTLYGNKTTLKNVEGYETEYMLSKEMINSCYGMTVTDISRDEIIYNGEWDIKEADTDKDIDKYNTSWSRFLYYPWGVWITAYARRNLFTGIYSCGDDYVYSDTDSIKILNHESHSSYIEEYNNLVIDKLNTAMKYHGLDVSLVSPKTRKNEVKTLGLWDYEGTYTRFKTLGAKRYLTEKEGDYTLTVSGLSKRAAIEYMKSKGDPFTLFNDNLYIPPEHTGKMTHTYIDSEHSGIIEDYTGLKNRYYEKSSVHLEKCDYSLSLSEQYKNFLLQIEERAF